MANTFVGIDVAQHQSDLAVRGAEDIDGLPHDQESLEPLSDRLTALAPDRIVMEATSGLEVILATSLQDVGLPVVVVRLCQARAFGHGRGRRPHPGEEMQARDHPRGAAALRARVESDGSILPGVAPRVGGTRVCFVGWLNRRRWRPSCRRGRPIRSGYAIRAAGPRSGKS